MILDQFSDLNWLAVLVATVAYFVIGAVWYSDALMGKQWRAATGQEMGASGRPEPKAMVVNFVGWFIAAMVLGLISTAIGASTVLEGLVLGLVVSIGFIGTNRIVQGMYEGSNKALMRVNAPYTMIGYSVMGIILAVM